MALVLTTASSAGCMHEGAVVTTGSAKLTVAGDGVLLDPGGLGAIGGCTTPPDASTGNIPCTAVASVTAGRSSKLTVSGRPVLLDTLAGTTNGSVGRTAPQVLDSAAAGHTKLSAAS